MMDDACGKGQLAFHTLRITGELTLGSIGKAERQLARNCNRGLVCEVLFFSLL